MKILFLVLASLISFPTWAQSTCEVTPAGKAQFNSLHVASCGQDLCVSYTRHNGRSGLERLTARGCNSNICFSTSRSFTYTYPVETQETRYLGDPSGYSVFLICP